MVMGFEGEIKGVPGFPCPGRMTSFLRASAKNKPLLDGLWIVTAFQANKKLSESGILHFFQVSGRPAGSGSELRWRKACAELQRFFFFLFEKLKKKNTRETHEGFLFTSKIFNQTRNAFINSTKGGFWTGFISWLVSWMIQNVISVLWLFPSLCVCVCVCVLVTQSCLTLCNPMDCSPPGSSVYRVFQARILEGVAMLSSGDLPNPGIEPECLVSPALAGKFLPLGHLGSPFLSCTVR